MKYLKGALWGAILAIALMFLGFIAVEFFFESDGLEEPVRSTKKAEIAPVRWGGLEDQGNLWQF